VNILLIAGGWSPEREVSLSGAKQIHTTLLERGHTVIPFDPSEAFDTLATVAKNVDVAFINLHGSPGEDGLIQAILTQVNCPYQGSSAQGSLLALHKAAAKQLFREAGLTTADWVFLPKQPDATWRLPFSYPAFAKGNTAGSSLHLSQVQSEKDLHTTLAKLFLHNDAVLVEPTISGQELTCGVLENPETRELEALPPVLIIPKQAFFDYHNKYAPDGAEELCPAPISAEQTHSVQAAAISAHRALGLEDYSRADFILTPDNTLYILEVNTLPGMTSGSLIPKEAAAIGLSFGELLERLLTLAVKKKRIMKRS